MVAFFRYAVADLGILSDVFTYLWEKNMWPLIPPFLVLSLFLLLLKGFVWLMVSPYKLRMFFSNSSQKRLERKVEAEGRDIYPLW